MKNVLMFTHSLSGGGAEKAVRRLSRYINSHDLGYKVFVCVVYDDPDYHGEVDNLLVLNTRSDKDDSKFTKAINVLKQINEIRKIKKRYEIDICVSFLPGADIINVLSGAGEKKIVSVRNKESLFTHNIFKKIYVKTSYKLCDKIVAVTEVVRQDCIDFFKVPPEKIVTIHNAVDEKKPAAGTIKTEIGKFMENSRILVNAGRLSVEKGQAHLIKAFSVIAPKYPDYKLLILGEGYFREKLQKLIEKLGLSERVLLAGRVNNPADYFSMSDIFVLASDVEGMPNVILEAMQSGLPCISTDCGAREILAPKTPALSSTQNIEMAEYGILVPVCGYNSIEEDDLTGSLSGEEKILAQAIEQLISDDELVSNYVEKGTECVDHFSVDKIVDAWINIFDS